MNYQIFNDPFPHLIIEETFDNVECDLIWRELSFLLNKLHSPERYYAAKNEDGSYMTNAKGMSLDDLYQGDNRSVSDILTILENKFFNNSQLDKDLIESNEYWNTFQKANRDFTKIRRYVPGDDYSPHRDHWVHALISTTFCNEEDDGGNLYFPRHDYEFETRNNKTIMFPGWVEHAVTNVIKNERYAITKFCTCTSR